jgi:hypothetical protein
VTRAAFADATPHWAPDIAPDQWWTSRTLMELAIGYRRWCDPCGRMRTPWIRGEFGFQSLLGGPVLFQHCTVCDSEWRGAALTALWKQEGDTIRLGLRGTSWWTYDEVTLDALRSCPDVRGAVDMIWERMERAGRYMQVEGGHR